MSDNKKIRKNKRRLKKVDRSNGVRRKDPDNIFPHRYDDTLPDNDGSSVNRKRLTRLQSRFVDEYMIDFNAARAYRTAGGKATGKSVFTCAASMLSYPHIQEEVRKRQRMLREDSGVKARDVIKELCRIGFANMRDFAEWSEADGVQLKDSVELPQELASCVAEVNEMTNKQGHTTIKIKLHPKVQALKMLGDHLSLFEVDKDKGSESSDEKARNIKEAIDNLYASVPTSPVDSNVRTISMRKEK